VGGSRWVGGKSLKKKREKKKQQKENRWGLGRK
jgi:hypothetical protein